MIETRLSAVVTVRRLVLLAFCVGLAGQMWGEERDAAEKPAVPPAIKKLAFKKLAFKKLTNVEYARHGNVSLLADLFVPQGEGVFPGVIVVHGGAWRHGSKDRYTALATELVKRGYSVMVIDYRLAPQHKFPAQLEDCVSALGWLHQNAQQYKVDPSRIGAWGYSAGAQMVALLGATAPSERAGGDDADQDGKKLLKKKGQLPTDVRLQAVVAGGTPSDFRNWLPAESQVFSYWLGETRANRPDVYEQASPRHFLSKDDPPMFFFHGEKDAIVPVRFGRTMANELAELGVQTVFHLVPDKGHLLARFDETALLAGFAFLDEHLKTIEAAGGPQDR